LENEEPTDRSDQPYIAQPRFVFVDNPIFLDALRQSLDGHHVIHVIPSLVAMKQSRVGREDSESTGSSKRRRVTRPAAMTSHPLGIKPAANKLMDIDISNASAVAAVDTVRRQGLGALGSLS